jgi:predicted nucleic acid-binding protein
MAPKTYLDVNIFVYWLTDPPEFGEKALQWIKNVEDSPGNYMTSALTIYETSVIIAGLLGKTLKDLMLVSQVNTVFQELGIKIIPLTHQQLTEAPSLMKKYNLDYEDAIHLNAAMENDATRIISNDKDFDKTPFIREF